MPSTRPFPRRRLSGLLLLILLALPLASAAAQTGVTFTLGIKSAFARAVPALNSMRTASLFQGDTFPVNGRTADGRWVRLDYPGALAEAWIQASFRALNGNPAPVPGVQPPAFGPGPTATPLPGQTAAPPTQAPPAYQPPESVIPTVNQTA